MKQTAIEFYHLELKKILNNIIVTKEQVNEMIDALEKAKEMEKEQIIDAHNDGGLDGDKMGTIYYNETFKK